MTWLQGRSFLWVVGLSKEEGRVYIYYNVEGEGGLLQVIMSGMLWASICGDLDENVMFGVRIFKKYC